MRNKKSLIIPITFVDSNHCFINLRINNVYGKFILDTGASNSCINLNLSKKFKISLEKSNKKASSATNEINEVYCSNNKTISIEDYKLDNFKILLFDMSYINESLKKNNVSELEGIIGNDFLIKFNAVIYYNSKKIKLYF